MKPNNLHPTDELGQFIWDQQPPVIFPKAFSAVGLRPTGGYESQHRIPAHDDQEDPNAPLIDSGHSPSIHDRAQKEPVLFE